MTPARLSLERADHISLIGPKTVNAAVLGGPEVTGKARTGDSLVDALADAFNPCASGGILPHLKTVRKSLEAKEREAAACIADAEDTADKLCAMADFLADDDKPLPSGLPDHVSSALYQLRAAKAAGIAVDETLIRDAERTADAIRKSAEHYRLVAKLRAATMRVGFGKASAEYLDRASELLEETNATRAGAFRRAAARFRTSVKRYQAQHRVHQKALGGRHG